MTSPLILPGDPEFDATLGTTLTPGWREVRAATNGDFAFIVRPGSCLLEAVTGDELEEYLGSGEYDDRLEEIGDEDLEEDGW